MRNGGNGALDLNWLETGSDDALSISEAGNWPVNVCSDRDRALQMQTCAVEGTIVLYRHAAVNTFLDGVR